MKKLRQKIGLIGCGHMGSSILNGLLRERLAKPSQIYVFDVQPKKSRLLSKSLKIKSVARATDLLKHVDVIILAVKPQNLPELAELRPFLDRCHILISILAGTPLSKLKRVFGSRVEIARAMPNLAASVGCSMTGITASSRNAKAVASAIFKGCGATMELTEKKFDTLTAVSGSGPAYFFLVMEFLMRFAFIHGIPQHLSKTLAVQTAKGAALLAEAASDMPDQLRQAVTSKKGTTEAALLYFKKHKLEQLFLRALDRARKRSKELSRN